MTQYQPKNLLFDKTAEIVKGGKIKYSQILYLNKQCQTNSENKSQIAAYEENLFSKSEIMFKFRILKGI